MNTVPEAPELCFSLVKSIPNSNNNFGTEITNRVSRIETNIEQLNPSTSSFKLDTFLCQRCEQKILTVDMESHKLSHSTEILPFLFLGGERNAKNFIELTKRTGITHIVNMSWEVANYFPGQFEYTNLPLTDVPECSILDALKEGIKKIEEIRQKGGKVLVHCVQGISRSASLVIAYLADREKMTLEEALQFVQRQRSIVQPNSGFMKQLLEFTS